MSTALRLPRRHGTAHRCPPPCPPPPLCASAPPPPWDIPPPPRDMPPLNPPRDMPPPAELCGAPPPKKLRLELPMLCDGAWYRPRSAGEELMPDDRLKPNVLRFIPDEREESKLRPEE